MFTSPALPSIVLVLTLALSSCAAPKEEKREAPAANTAQVAAAEAALVEQITHTPDVDKIDNSLRHDQQALIALASWGPANEPEQKAVAEARQAISLVKAARDAAEKNKQIAFEAKNLYGQKLQAYQSALADAEAARKARAKAMSALAAAQKEHDDAWAAVSAARDLSLKAVSDPAATPAQKASADAALARATVRAEQAAALVNTRTIELQASQQSGQSQLAGGLSAAAEATARAGASYAEKAGIATRALEELNRALSEEKKAMSTVHALNRARAKVVADTLANAAFQLTQAQASSESAAAAAKSATASKQNAESRLAGALKDAASAKDQVSATAEASARAARLAQQKAQEKAQADSEAARAQQELAAAKLAFDASNSVSSKSAADAWRASKALSDASARAEKAEQAANWAAKAHEQKNSPESQKAMDTLRAAAVKAAEELKAAREALPALKEKSEADAAVTARAKAELDAKLLAARQASSLAATAARDKAQADASVAATTKAAAAAIASSQARAAEAERAKSAALAASEASARAEQQAAAAAQAAREARQHHERVYAKVEAYKLSVNRSEQEELSDEQKLYAAALWAKVPEGNFWTSLVIAEVRENLDKLEKARDINDWCPGYWSATEHQREVCWLRLIGAIVKFESSFKPEDKFREPSGAWSVGLLALSPKECKRYETVEMLQKPLLNLSCGIAKLAGFVERDGYLHGPSEAPGASRYWSTLRTPYTQRKPDGSGHYKLGKKNEIQAFTHPYRSY